MIENIIVYLTNITFFGNEIWRFVAFLVSITLVYPVAKITQFILKNYMSKWAEKTSFKFDDIIISSLNPSITMFIFAGFFYLGSSFIDSGIYDEVFTKIFNFLMIIPFVYFMIKFSTEMIGFYLKGEEKKGKINEVAIDLLMQVIRIGLFLIGILLILGNLGYNISALLTGLGIGGLAFALAAQDVLKNFFAGVALIIDGTFKKGDRIRFEGNVSFVNEVKLRTTKLRTLDGTILTVPNSMLSENIVENIAKAPKYKVNQVIGVTYGTSSKKLRETKKIIEGILEKHEDVGDYWVMFDNFGAYSLDVQVIYFLKFTYSDWPARGIAKEAINFEIKERLEKAGIEFAFPTQTLDIPALNKVSKKK